MSGTRPSSSVMEFFDGARVFITGGTGFLGKAIIEKFLRVFDNVDHVYVLIRPKKGKDPLTRMKELFEDPLFDTVRKEKPGFEKKVACIFGDVGRARLDMSDSDYELLTREVTHVIHSAATVRFNEKLKTALEINVLGAHEISMFANDCARLKVLVHISTAYAHCVRKVIAEDLYEPPIPGDKALDLVKILGEEKLDSLTDELIKPWPNTYSYTKSIAESVIKENCKSIPSVIFRPGIVMGTMNEPVQGWIDNIYGPTGIIVAVGVGLMRVMYVDKTITANVIPVDLTVNAILSCAWKTGIDFQKKNSPVGNSSNEPAESSKKAEVLPPVYNFVVDETNSISWDEFLKVNKYYGIRAPSKRAIWYYTLTLTKVRFIYYCLIILLHYIPAILADSVFLLLGKKPQMLKAYNKIHNFSDMMVVFALGVWKFENQNMRSLWSQLSDADKELFNFDMAKINWDYYFSGVIKGIRSYIFKEEDHTLSMAKRRMFFFWIGHRLVQFCFLAFWFWILAKCFFSFDHTSQFKDPLLMSSNLLRNST